MQVKKKVVNNIHAMNLDEKLNQNQMTELQRILQAVAPLGHFFF